MFSLANNHALDFGDDGRASTRRVLDDLGIAHSGEVGDIARLTVRGRKVDLIAFTTSSHSYNLNRLSRARAAVEKLVADGDIVIVSFHGGAEGAASQHVLEGEERFLGTNRGDLRLFAHAMIDAGAAAVIGHGPHVVRAMEVYRGHLIAYSLGNFATYGGIYLSGPSRLSLILELRLAADGQFLSAIAHPVIQEHRGGPLLDRRGRVLRVLRALSDEDFPETGVTVARDGTISGGPPRPPRRSAQSESVASAEPERCSWAMCGLRECWPVP